MSENYTVNYDPATGRETGKTLLNSSSDVSAAYSAAFNAQKIWSSFPFSEREKALVRMRDYIVENSQQISTVISGSTGKTRVDALAAEVLPAALAADYYAKNGKRILREKRIKGGSILLANKISYLRRVPIGVAGIISPWNYPFSIPVHEIFMAIVAGNGVILKVASQCLETGKEIEKLISSSGLPSGLVSLINLPGEEAGKVFISSGIDKLFFTGSVTAGKKLLQLASQRTDRILPVSLELGGNDAMIVCSDANIKRAVNTALWAGFSNAGQSCGGVERIFVEDEVYDTFTRLLKVEADKLRIGKDKDFSVDIGSLTTVKQLEKIKTIVDDAVRKGASASVLGQLMPGSEDGLFHRLVIFENSPDNASGLREEIFGPVLFVNRVKSADEAVEKANDSQLGLTASVWTGSSKKALKIAEKLQSGAVTINDHLMSHGMAETPWGGFKNSGIGRTHGEPGLLEMTQPQVVIYDLLSFMRKNIWHYPYDRRVFEALQGALYALYSKKILKKLAGTWKVIKIFLSSF